MKILFCTPTFLVETHGPSNFAKHLIHLNYPGSLHQLSVITEDTDTVKSLDFYPINFTIPRLIHSLKNIIRGFSYQHEVNKIKKGTPLDCIVFNNAIIGWWSAISFKNDSTAVVGMINDAHNIEISQLGQTRPFRKKLIRNVFRFFERLAARNMDGVLVNSNFLRNEVIQKHGISPEKIFVLYKGIDLDKFEFCPKEQTSTEKVVRVLFVKNNYEVGGLFYLIEALGFLQTIQFELIIIGPSPEKELVIKKKASKFENISIKFLGPQPQTEVIRQLRNSDLLSIPSVSEGLGVANIEGLAVGIPVVSTRVGGIPEVLGNGKYGWLAEPGDPSSLASCIEICLNNPEERNRKARAGRKFVEQQFSHTVMLDNFLSILEEVKAKA